MRYLLLIFVIVLIYIKFCGKSYESTTIYEQVFGQEPPYQSEIENIINGN